MNTNAHMSPKDFFLHLGAMIALYAGTIALINLAFEILNRALPDALTSYYSTSSVVWPISMLIVLTPILYVLERLINRDIVKIPEKRDLWIRRWRIYLTLFLTGVTIAVDIIVLIDTYLNGEISSRFIWKILVVLVVSAVIFAYYILAKNAVRKTWLTVLAVVGIVLVLIGIVSGFIIVGSPSTQRAIRFDEQRVNFLSSIQGSVVHYSQEFGKVPVSLSAMPEYVGGVPKDPVTMVPYHYEPGAQTNSFIICATFSASSSQSTLNSPYTIPASQSSFYDWSHGIGEVCFNRTISPVDYPPISK